MVVVVVIEIVSSIIIIVLSGILLVVSISIVAVHSFLNAIYSIFIFIPVLL